MSEGSFYDNLHQQARRASSARENWTVHCYSQERFALICTIDPGQELRLVYEGRLPPGGVPVLRSQRGCFYYLEALTLVLMGLLVGFFGAVYSAGSFQDLLRDPKHLSFLFIGLALSLPTLYLIRQGYQRHDQTARQLVLQALE